MSGTPQPIPVDVSRIDQRVIFWDVPWEFYDSALATRGDHGIPRLTYSDGALEIMSPSPEHESLSLRIHTLLAVWAEETGTELNAFGAWTVRRKSKKRGVEADQSYVLGTSRARVPDLAIEVIWTHGGLDKLDVYPSLGVPEVWFWVNGRIDVHVLGRSGYRKRKSSALLPSLDVGLLARFLPEPSQLRAIRSYRAALRSARRPN